MQLQRALSIFSKKIAGRDSISVVVQPEPWAKAAHCFRNVRQKVRENGEEVFGWLFTIRYGVLIAHHHAIWRSPAGDLIDITPHDKGEGCVGDPVGIRFVGDVKATPTMSEGRAVIATSKYMEYKMHPGNRRFLNAMRNHTSVAWGRC
jgi:hypothetical protein